MHGTLIFKYLGVPSSTKKLTLLQWQPLIEKITARITSWTAKILSYAGRIQLVKSILFEILAYWARLFLIPAKVLKTIYVYCKKFVWSGSNIITKKALVAWDKVCTLMSMGGLNLINIKLWNQAAQIKICWDITHKQDKM